MYCVLRITHPAVRWIAYCVLRISYYATSREVDCVLRIAYCVLAITQPAVRWIAYCVLRCVLRIAYCVFMGSDPRKPKLENHWARRKSDKTARETMEHTGATTELRGERESGERGPTSMINTGGARRREERSNNCTTAVPAS